MKNIILIVTGLCVLLSSCEEYPGSGTYENPLLKYYGDAFVDRGSALVETGGGYALAGMRTVVARTASEGGSIIDSSGQEFAVLKTGSGGSLDWSFLSSNSVYDEARTLIGLDDGSILAAGYTGGSSASAGKDILVTLLDAQGGVQWQKSYGGEGDQITNDVILCDDSGFIILGSTNMENTAGGIGRDNPSGRLNVFILKISLQGDSLWSNSVGFEGDDEGIRITEEAAGDGYMVLASTDISEPDKDQDQNNIFFFRINSVGTGTKYNIFGTAGNETPTDMLVHEDSYVILSASGSSSAADTEIFMLRIGNDIQAAPMLDRRISLEGKRVVLRSVCRHPDGFYVIAGGVGDPLEEDMLFYFMNDDGSSYAPPHSPAGQGSQVVNDVIIDGAENIVAVGTNGTEVSSLITLYKFEKPR